MASARNPPDIGPISNTVTPPDCNWGVDRISQCGDSFDSQAIIGSYCFEYLVSCLWLPMSRETYRRVKVALRLPTCRQIFRNGNLRSLPPSAYDVPSNGLYWAFGMATPPSETHPALVPKYLSFLAIPVQSERELMLLGSLVDFNNQMTQTVSLQTAGAVQQQMPRNVEP